MSIDYTALHDRIVQQAYGVLDKAQVEQLVKEKIERALALKEAQGDVARGSKYTSS